MDYFIFSAPNNDLTRSLNIIDILSMNSRLSFITCVDEKLNHPKLFSEMKLGPESLQHATVSPDTVSQTLTFIC